MADRRATLYTIEAHTVIVRNADSFVIPSLEQERGPNGEFFTPTSVDYKITNVPIHAVYRDDGGSDWIAIHPKLKAILEQPYKERLAQAELDARNNFTLSRENLVLTGFLLEKQQAIGTLRDRLRSFNASPWWKRLIIALKGKDL